MEKRSATVHSNETAKIFPLDGVTAHALVIQPIINAGELFGAVVLLSSEQQPDVPDEETQACAKMLSETIAALLDY